MTALALTVFALGAGGIYLLLSRRLLDWVMGLALLAHAANLIVLAGTTRASAKPAVHGPGVAVVDMADPLPQAMVLTAIVISMAVTVYLLALLVDRHRRAQDSEEAGS